MAFETKDSGQRKEFETGARRDMQEGKGRFDLIPFAPIKRVAQLYERGAIKYGANNWNKGIPLSSFLSSAGRHLGQLIDGQQDEDHAAAVVFNVFGFMWTLEQIKAGKLPESLLEEWHEQTVGTPENAAA